MERTLRVKTREDAEDFLLIGILGGISSYNSFIHYKYYLLA